jgi:hypothetical protein
VAEWPEVAQNPKTKRVVASCCNSAILMRFDDARALGAGLSHSLRAERAGDSDAYLHKLSAEKRRSPQRC